jgi:serine/threonine-protein kinase RsbT
MTQVSVVAVEVMGEADIVLVRVKAKATAEAIGFNYMDQTRIATAVSELARNAFQYAGRGRVTITPVERQGGRGMEIVVEDHGSGIKDLELALKGGYSTSKGLGMGLSGSKKLMDEFEIKTKVGEGTTVTIRKWL